MLEDLWYKNAVIYSLDLETFLDSDGNGVGDFKGLNTKLDYLQALGIDTLWLAPFQPTPNKDNGYDIKDYYGVDPRHGSSGDFVEFMHQAKKRGFKILIDLVVNHTSDQHPWFQDARKGKDAKHHDWYIWSDKRPPNWNEGMVFPGVQKAVWTRDEKCKKYYFHRFYEFQPDLNMDNPEVREEVMRIMGYWLQLGVDGFRVDAVPFILEAPPKGDKKSILNFEYLSAMRRFLQWRKGDAIMLGEANVLPTENKKYFGEEGDGIHLMFNFYVNQYLFYSLATTKVEPLIKALEATKDIHPTSQWAQFLRNHDELDLGRLTEEERQQVFAEFGPEERMQLYERGIRRRLSPMLGSNQRSELAYSLAFSLPGTPVIRYGDEIGMGDNLKLKERDAVRTPMHWSNDYQAGFSKSEKLVHPVIDKGPYAYQHINVEDQRRQQNSKLNWITALIRLRKECPEIGYGQWEIIDTERPTVLCMHYTWKHNSLYVIHNFDSEPHEIHLKGDPENIKELKDLMVRTTCAADEKGVYHITLDAYGYKWLRLD